MLLDLTLESYRHIPHAGLRCANDGTHHQARSMDLLQVWPHAVQLCQLTLTVRGEIHSTADVYQQLKLPPNRLFTAINSEEASKKWRR